MRDPNFKNLLEWRSDTWKDENNKVNAPPIFKFEREKKDEETENDSSVFDNVRRIKFKDERELIKMLEELNAKSQDPEYLVKEKRIIKKYLDHAIQQCSRVELLGFNNHDVLELEMKTVYVSLKFDPTHPSIKAMKRLEYDIGF